MMKLCGSDINTRRSSEHVAFYPGRRPLRVFDGGASGVFGSEPQKAVFSPAISCSVAESA